MIRLPPNSELLDAKPPSADDAELSLLASLLIDPSIMPDVAKALDEKHWRRYDCRACWKAMRELYRETKGIDAGKLLKRLAKADVRANWNALVADIIDSSPHAKNWKEHAAAIREAAAARQVIAMLLEGVKSLYDGGRPRALAASLARRLNMISNQ